jgi:Flp pilus assembly protein TadD
MSRRAARAWAQAIAVCSVALAGPFGSACGAQLVKTPQNTAAPTQSGGGDASTADPQRELDIGADLTRRGSLQEAIPHLLAAQKAGADPYATAVNLGICYLGSGRNKEAIAVLESLRASGSRTSTVDKLLAQAYVADGQRKAAYGVFAEASAANPKDESVYEFFADACTDHQEYALGLLAVDRGLQELPDSARLHYERAVFLARLGRLEEGKPEFDRAAQLEPSGYIGYLALVQKDLYEDDLAAANEVLHRAIKAGHRDYQMLSLLGTVLLHEGAAPGQPEFAEAQAALEESAKDRPDYSATQIALGKVYLMQGRFQDAVDRLEMARNLEPDNPAVYANLASAYSRLGDRAKARQMEAQVGRLLAEKKSNLKP